MRFTIDPTLTVIKHLLDNALGQITITDALPETLDFLANPDPGVAYAPIAVYINDRDHRLTFTPGA